MKPVFGPRLLRLAVAGVIAVAGVAKLISGYQPHYSLPSWLFYTLAVAEALLGLALYFLRSVIPVVGAIVLAVGGVAASFVPGQECGCFGSLVRVTRLEERMIASVIGALSGLILAVERAQPSGETCQE